MQKPITNALIIISLHTVLLSQFAVQQCGILNLPISSTKQTLLSFVFSTGAVDMYVPADKKGLINYCPF